MPCDFFWKRRKHQQTDKTQKFLDTRSSISQSASTCLYSGAPRPVGDLAGAATFLSNRKYRYRPYTQPDVGNCWPCEGKQRRNFVGELVGATCTTSCLLTHQSQCQCACNIERLPRLFFFFFAFSSYLEWQRPFRANPGKKELVERNSVDLALRVRGCTKEFKGRLKNDCNTLMNLSLSLFSVSLLFFS